MDIKTSNARGVQSFIADLQARGYRVEYNTVTREYTVFDGDVCIIAAIPSKVNKYRWFIQFDQNYLHLWSRP